MHFEADLNVPVAFAFCTLSNVAEYLPEDGLSSPPSAAIYRRVDQPLEGTAPIQTTDTAWHNLPVPHRVSA